MELVLADLIESSTSYWELTVDILSVYLTVTSGDLIVAYLAGDKLTGSQMVIISTLYVFIAGMAAYGATEWAIRALYFARQMELVDGSIPMPPSGFVPAALGSFLSAGIIACLTFMWRVRHPKTE
jgi:hypothetical protein